MRNAIERTLRPGFEDRPVNMNNFSDKPTSLLGSPYSCRNDCREQSMTREALKRSKRLWATSILATAVVLGALQPAESSYGQQSQTRAREDPGQQTGAQNRNIADAEVHVLPVQGNVYMLVGAGGNITLQVGNEGILLVDTGLAPMSDKVIAAIRKISDEPIRYIINTHVHRDHTGGNEAIAKLGSTIAGGNVVGNIGESASSGATVIGFQSILERMSAANGKDTAPEGAWPTDTFTTPQKNLFFNGEAIQIFHQPGAHTDGDSIIFFRRSDVVSTGDLFTTTNYPIVNLERGGNIQGIIDGLNRLV